MNPGGVAARLKKLFGGASRGARHVRHLGSPRENAELARSEYRDGKLTLESLPPVVNFVPTTFCNSNPPCVTCNRNTRPPGSDTETDRRVIRAVEPLIKTALSVVLHMGGEPMFTSHFDSLIALTQPPTRVQFFTNGMLMTGDRSDFMLERDIMGTIFVSFDAATPETYGVIRPSLDFQTVVANTEYYIRRAAELGRPHSLVSLSMVICRANLHDVPKLIDLAARIGAREVFCRHLNEGLDHSVTTTAGWDWVYHEQARFEDPALHDELILEAYHLAKSRGIRMIFYGTPFIGPDADKVHKAVADEMRNYRLCVQPDEEPWSSEKHYVESAGANPCFVPWRQVTIEPKGEVRLCGFHDITKWQIGNVGKSSFMEIWNSDLMVKQRERFLTHGFAQSCSAGIPCGHRGRV